MVDGLPLAPAPGAPADLSELEFRLERLEASEQGRTWHEQMQREEGIRRDAYSAARRDARLSATRAALVTCWVLLILWLRERRQWEDGDE